MKSSYLYSAVVSGLLLATGNAQAGSRWMAQPLTEGDCSFYVTEVLRMNLDQVKKQPTLKNVLQVLLAECEVTGAKDPAQLSQGDERWLFEGSAMVIEYTRAKGVSYRRDAGFFRKDGTRDDGEKSEFLVHVLSQSQLDALTAPAKPVTEGHWYDLRENIKATFRAASNNLKDVYKSGATENLVLWLRLPRSKYLYRREAERLK
jgi:hypothetical protein